MKIMSKSVISATIVLSLVAQGCTIATHPDHISAGSSGPSMDFTALNCGELRVRSAQKKSEYSVAYNRQYGTYRRDKAFKDAAWATGFLVFPLMGLLALGIDGDQQPQIDSIRQLKTDIMAIDIAIGNKC